MYLYGLGAHVVLYKALGAEGMSSDESEVEWRTQGPRPRNMRYRVSIKPWLSEQVRLINETVDEAIEANKRASYLQVHGSNPHVRVRTNTLSANPKIVVGLPRNAYDADWLRAQDDQMRAALEIDPNDHPFTA